MTDTPAPAYEPPIVARLPYRVVDGENQGWHPVGVDGGPPMYSADYGFQRNLPDRTWGDLVATRSPLRPVEPITDADEAELRELFAQAGRKTITTIAAALEAVFWRLDAEHRAGGPDRDGYWYARRTLMAGREGSWESEMLPGLIVFGNDLNLAKATKTLRGLAERRAAGPVRRVHKPARDAIAAMLHRWVTDPDRYTEVAATLASVVSSWCDDTAGRRGWEAVADQWLMPGGMAHQTFSECYRLLYSVSAHYDPALA